MVRSLFVTASMWLTFVCLLPARASAQAKEGPIAPQPGAPIQQPPPDAQATLKVHVSLVNTPVTVRNSGGRMVHDLEATDFTVTDNGVPQKITHFDLGGDALSIVIVVETSSRIEPLLPQIRRTGILLSQTVMGPTGEAAVVGFNDSIDKLQGFTKDQDRIERTVTHLQTGASGSRLYDAMTTGVEMLSSRPEATPESPGRRRILLVISEAVDQGSQTKLGEVLRQAQLSNVTIYTVGLSTTMAELKAPPHDTSPQITPPGTFPMPPQPGVPQTPTSEQQRYGSGGSGADLLALAVWAVMHAKNAVTAHALEVAAVGTGGGYFSTFKGHSMENAVDEIGGELHSQYSLTYVPTGTGAAGYHEIGVSVVGEKEKGLKVRARPGYYLAPPES